MTSCDKGRGQHWSKIERRTLWTAQYVILLDLFNYFILNLEAFDGIYQLVGSHFDEGLYINNGRRHRQKVVLAYYSSYYGKKGSYLIRPRFTLDLLLPSLFSVSLVNGTSCCTFFIHIAFDYRSLRLWTD